jgi:hypothetical protein
MREVVEIAEVEGLAFGDGRIGRGFILPSESYFTAIVTVGL